MKGNSSQEVSGSIQQKIGSTHVMEAGKEISLTSGGKLVVEAGSEVTFKVGGSFVKVDAAGVHLVGPGVNLNSGGSAGSASTYSASAPMLPKGVEPVAPRQAPPPVSLQSLKQLNWLMSLLLNRVRWKVITNASLLVLSKSRPIG